MHDERLDRVVEELERSGATSVLDLGCGSGKLLARLLKQRRFERIVGLDASSRELEIAADRPAARRTAREPAPAHHAASRRADVSRPPARRFDAAAIVEVIEHIDPPRLGAFADAVFGVARPRTIVLTTPNAEYNARYAGLDPDEFRHADHRFEWSRLEFRGWADSVAKQYGYELTIGEIGEADPELGAPTQMGVFLCG